MLLHFIIPAAATAVLVIFGEFPENQGGAPWDYLTFVYNTSPVIRITDNISVVMAVVYFSIVFIFYSKLSLAKKKETKKNYLVVVVFFILVLSFMGIYGYYYNNTGILHNLFKLRFTILAAFLILFTYRFPFLTNIKKLEAHREYYLKSRIGNIQTDEVLSSLENIMNGERLFRDAGLTIKTTAGKLGITPHQLSEILNTCLGKTFTGYIKEKRVQCAQELLVSSPGQSILAVSIECGFNAISNFNITFKDITGMSPGKYRKKHAGAVPGSNKGEQHNPSRKGGTNNTKDT